MKYAIEKRLDATRGTNVQIGRSTWKIWMDR